MIRRCLSASIRPAPVRVAVLAALVAALAMSAWLVMRGAHHGGWRIDEAYKLSETYALRHLLAGEVHHPDWFRTRIDRTNPPFGKYVFGLAVLVAGGQLPDSSTLTRADSPLDEDLPMFTDAESAPFLAMLPAARVVSLLSTALIGALIAYVAACVRGVAAAAIALALFAPHWLTDAFAATAIFDPLLTLLVLATAPLLMSVWDTSRRGIIVACTVGLLSAAAFQTRLNGGIAVSGALAVFLAAAALHRQRRLLFAAVVMAVVFLAATILINPYYWSSAPPDPAIPADIRAPRALPARIAFRFERQVSDLSSMLTIFTDGGVRMPLWAADTAVRTRTPWNARAKARFLFHAIVADAGGVLLLAGALLLAVVAIHTRHGGALFLLIWCGTIIVGTCAWLPVPWARYLYVILPPLALLAGVGWVAALERFAPERLLRWLEAGLS